MQMIQWAFAAGSSFVLKILNQKYLIYDKCIHPLDYYIFKYFYGTIKSDSSLISTQLCTYLVQAIIIKSILFNTFTLFQTNEDQRAQVRSD